VSDGTRCSAVTKTGAPCGVSWGLSSAGLCLMHDEARRAQADAARRAGGVTTGAAAAAQRNGKYRTLTPEQLGRRPARTRREIERNVALMAYGEGTGDVDPLTLREYVRACGFHRTLLNDRTLARGMADLKRQVKALKKGRAT